LASLPDMKQKSGHHLSSKRLRRASASLEARQLCASAGPPAECYPSEVAALPDQRASEVLWKLSSQSLNSLCRRRPLRRSTQARSDARPSTKFIVSPSPVLIGWRGNIQLHTVGRLRSFKQTRTVKLDVPTQTLNLEPWSGLQPHTHFLTSIA
jgi:hypothetical protein